MNIVETPLAGLLILEPRVFADDRGYFFESFNKATLEKLTGREWNFIQDNQARSSYGVLRGLHFQKSPHAQTKLVRVLEGAIWDVVVDLRAGSATYGRWYGVELSAENKRQFLVPQGFAHGYSVISETAEVFYKCDNYYHKESEGGIRYDDPELGIDWKIDLAKAVVSGKDLVQPLLRENKVEL